MTTAIDSRERFRKGFVLVMTLAYASMFLAMIGGFVMALLLAAVFSGIVYPLYGWLQRVLGGRNTLASLMTLAISLVAIVMPLLFLLGLVAEQALEVTEEVKPWIEQQLDKPARDEHEMPGWIPFADELGPYREKITTKVAEFAGKTGVYLTTSLGKLT